MIGYAMCGSYCTHGASLKELRTLSERDYEILGIVSENVYSTDTRFGKATDGTSTREVTCMTNKWRAKINWKETYNARSPPKGGGFFFFGKPWEGSTEEGIRTTSSSDQSRGQHFTL